MPEWVDVKDAVPECYVPVMVALQHPDIPRLYAITFAIRNTIAKWIELDHLMFRTGKEVHPDFWSKMPPVRPIPDLVWCPFCGADNVVVSTSLENVVVCNKCYAVGPRATSRIDAAEKWNTRYREEV